MLCPGPSVGSGVPAVPFHKKNATTAAATTITPINTGVLMLLLSTIAFPPRDCPGYTVGSPPDRCPTLLFPCAWEEEDRARPIPSICRDRSSGRLRTVIRELLVYFAVLRRWSREVLGMAVHDRVVHALGMPARLGPVIVAAAAPGLHAAVVVFGQHYLLGRLAN